MRGGYRIERSGRRSWRIVRADGTTLEHWEQRSKAAAAHALRPAELDAAWDRYQAWARVAMSASWDEAEEEGVASLPASRDEAAAADEEEGTMKTQHGGTHPSDRLSSGAVHDFEEALELVEQEVACADRADRIMDEGQAPIRAATSRARRVWREEQEAAHQRTVARLRVLAYDMQGDAGAVTDEAEWLGLLAEALEAGDYAGLAI